MGGSMMAWGRLAVVLTLVGALLGCDDAKKTYAMAPDAAKAALVGSRIPGMAFGMGAHSAPATASSSQVIWTILDGPGDEAGGGRYAKGHVIMKLAATLTAAGSGTQVAVDILPPDGANPGAIAKLDKDRPAIANLFRSIASEQVDATLTQRAFSMANLSQDMAVAIITQLPEIRKNMDAAAKEYERRNQETVDRAYATEKNGN